MAICHDARKGRHNGSRWPRLGAPPLYSTSSSLNGALRNGVSEVVCFRLHSDRAVECIEDYGFKGEEVRTLAPPQFVARNRDRGGKLRGKIEV